MSAGAVVDADALREEVKSKYREVAIDPYGTFRAPTDSLFVSWFAQWLKSGIV